MSTLNTRKLLLRLVTSPTMRLRNMKFASNLLSQAARLAQSVEHETLNLRVVGSSPTLGERTFSYHRVLIFFSNSFREGTQMEIKIQFMAHEAQYDGNHVLNRKLYLQQLNER